MRLGYIQLTTHFVEVKDESGVAVLFVHLAVEEDDLPARDDHVELLPAVSPDILFARRLQPALQTGLCVAQLSLGAD